MVHKNIGVQHNHLNTSFLTKTNGEDRGWWKVEVHSAGIKGLYTRKSITSQSLDNLARSPLQPPMSLSGDKCLKNLQKCWNKNQKSAGERVATFAFAWQGWQRTSSPLPGLFPGGAESLSSSSNQAFLHPTSRLQCEIWSITGWFRSLKISLCIRGFTRHFLAQISE